MKLLQLILISILMPSSQVTKISFNRYFTIWVIKIKSFGVLLANQDDPFKMLRLAINFTNIIRAAFSYESFARSFFVLRFVLRFVLFWRKNIGAKAACNMLVKLTLGF